MLTTFRSCAQEVSELLGGKITNQDEEEVEEELAALEAEEAARATLPEVPTKEPPSRVATDPDSMPKVPNMTEPIEPQQPERQAIPA
jgi:charged multivesicular body protein 6